MLINDFFTYTIDEYQDSKLIATININPNHAIFKGHFPGMPITPGICQVQIVQELISDYFKATYTLKKARDIKFLNFINPTEISTLTLELKLSDNSDEELSVNALLHKNEVNYLKMRSVFCKKSSTIA